MKNNCKGLELQTSSPFLVLYVNRVNTEKFNSWIPLSDLKNIYKRLFTCI